MQANLIVASLLLTFITMLSSQVSFANFFNRFHHQQPSYDDSDDYDDDSQSNGNNYRYGFKSFRHLASIEENTFIFSPRQLRWFAYNAMGYLVASGRASGGQGYCPDINRRCRTPVGTFRVHSKGGPGCVSSKFPIGEGGSPMPYCMFFKGGLAVHGSYEIPNYNASHGCIRIEPSWARWLSHNFMSIGTKVIVQPY